MVFLDGLKMFFSSMNRNIREFFGDSSYASRRFKELIILLVASGIIVSSYCGYRWYVVHREQNAHYALADYVQEIQRAVTINTPEEWQRMSFLLDQGYVQHKGSNSAPLFLVFKAEAQMKNDDREGALKTLDYVITLLPDSSPLLGLVRTKKVLMELDSDDSVRTEIALQSLTHLARDTHNQYRDIALFYLGKYYWFCDRPDEAKQAWQELADSSTYAREYPSAWAQEAAEQLKRISA